MKKILFSCAALLLAASSYAQDNALWLRNPAISPDGKTIVFGYKGDIYRVDANGGVAVPLTIHEAHDMMPVWSHDGKSIAFASDRYGNFDVFVMPATGGTPVRLTTNSAADYPYDFTPDNKQVLFGSVRNAPAVSVRFPYRIFRNVYTVPVTGGRAVLLSAAGMDAARYNKDGSKIVFQDRKGYEDPFRKHHTSAVTRDIWVMDVAKGKYDQLSAYEGEDREPVFGNNNEVYYLSEKGGISQNLFKSSLTDKSSMQQLTSFTNHPVRSLTRADNGVLSFTYNGEIYTLKEGDKPKKINVQIFNDGRESVVKNMPVSGNITEFAMSPDGKQMAFVARGEVYVTSVEGNMTKRLTNTPQQERMVNWSPDGKKVVYAAERNGNWDIFQSTIVRKEEPFFFNATLLKEEPLIATSAEEFQPLFSPDGKEVAFVENRNELKVLNIASGKTRTILPEGHNHSYSDGDWSFNWSPDSKWLLVDDEKNYFGSSNLAVLAADGKGTPFYPINSGFGEGNGKWAAEGKMMTWYNNREGRKSLAKQGSREVDIYAVFLDQEAYDKFKLSKDEFNLLKEGGDAKKDTAKSKEKDTTAKKTWQPNFDNLENRRVRLTINSASISDYVLNKDGSKVFYMAAFEKGFDLWVTEPRTGETKILAKLGGTPGGLELSKDGNTVFVSNRGSVVKVDANSGKITPVTIGSEMALNQEKEREYIYWHTWKQVKEKFYDPKLHGLDWKMYGDNYAKFLPYISNNYDFQELLSELLGELNASHTGGRYSPMIPNGDVTAALGLLYDEASTADGLKVDEVINGGPLDKASSKLRKGDIIEKIDGVAINSSFDWATLLNRKVNSNVLLSIYNPDTKQRWDEIVKPISAGEESGLLYKRWTDRMSKLVDKLSGGKVGYVHVEGMNDASFRSVYDVVMGKNKDKKALIVDTRFNGGGWLHDDLYQFLSGKKYLEFAPQGNRLNGGEPMGVWQGPSCVVMSEGNYSDAFIFPYVYKQGKLGKLVGMPVAGTGTAVWWETQIDPTIVFGIPMVATIGAENRPTENLQVEPDIRVPLPFEGFLAGTDAQMEAAVKEMLKEIK
ncbi:C-terminal processing protease CtpA/Prc, contains a PDZ domain [Chitinophaga jiangningensis]|uniref:Tricorn protease homolog n=1 Tax=Chitinophaga jiangningensis TaxID=1419482 RepID=A0A1M7LLP2_9BACT|nr:LpqB family beta-propeller domain-containing protein [Chitinophaga jiangningensis]SHM78948.1 C-terminal processing protease CtpA/Prc, contains a PDZ domain [Chitinophaga jiangningensis]